jgi:hypothetical protein
MDYHFVKCHLARLLQTCTGHCHRHRSSDWAGVQPEHVGLTLKVDRVDRVVEPVVTVTLPVSAPAGTVARMNVPPLS